MMIPRSTIWVIAGWIAGIFLATTIVGNASEMPQSGVYYKIQARHSNLFLDVLGQAQHDGANVGQWENHDFLNQQWTFEEVPYNRNRGLYYIRARHSGGLLDVLNQQAHRGANVGVWSPQPTGLRNQMWRLYDLKNGYFRIQAAHSKKYLDVQERYIYNEGNVFQWDWDPGYQQQWKLIALNRPSRSWKASGKPVGLWIPFCEAGGQQCKRTITASITTGNTKTDARSREVTDAISVALSAGIEVKGFSASSEVTSSHSVAVSTASEIASSKERAEEMSQEEKTGSKLE